VGGPRSGRGLAGIASNPDAFERFYREHVEAVERFVARRVEDPHLAADLTADVFVAAIESAGSYRRARGAPAGWLYGIARHVVLDERRRRGREVRATARIRGRDLVDEEDLAALHERIDAAAGARSLYREMDRLPDGERAVLELVALDGLSVGEAARALDIGPIAARVRLHRARRALQDRLAPPALDIGDLPEVSS
jgi:RNA polymerase sigma factor (sigma-70 family)